MIKNGTTPDSTGRKSISSNRPQPLPQKLNPKTYHQQKPQEIPEPEEHEERIRFHRFGL
jgi:hypothetical protein